MRVSVRSIAVFAVLPVSLSLLFGAVRADDAGAALKADTGTQHAAEIYAHICQACHMSQGRGAVGGGHYPALAGDPALVSWEYVALTVLQGRKAMPAFGVSAEQATRTRSVHLDDSEIADIVNYVRGHFGNHFKHTVTAQDVARLPHAELDGDQDQ
jgi:mono/diheme cytochrome c family protein